MDTSHIRLQLRQPFNRILKMSGDIRYPKGFFLGYDVCSGIAFRAVLARRHCINVCRVMLCICKAGSMPSRGVCLSHSSFCAPNVLAIFLVGTRTTRIFLVCRWKSATTVRCCLTRTSSCAMARSFFSSSRNSTSHVQLFCN